MFLQFFRQDQSGGDGYAKRASLYQHTLWLGYKNCVARWLSHDERFMQASRSELVIIGSNSGYSLPDAVLKMPQSLVLVEPDRKAAVRLSERVRQIPGASMKIEIINRSDLLSRQLPDWLLSRPQGLSAAVLFSNVLGQNFIGRVRLKSDLQTLLPKNPWASYHDVFSVKLKRPLQAQGLRQMQVLERDFNRRFAYQPTIDANLTLETLTELIARMLPEAEIESIIDHETTQLKARLFGLWILTPQQIHIIGFSPTTVPEHNPPGKENP